jgi:hypothetical protein
MIEIRKKLLASALGLALGGFSAASCIDNSGNKTYPRDAGAVDEGVEAATDTPATSDAPGGDGAPGDTAGPDDTAAGDTGGDRGGDTAAASDAGDASGSDLRVDLGAG